MKTLVVDDDLASRLVMEDALCHFGTVDVCGDGEEAVRTVRLALERGEPYDLISMDIMMPSMSGLDALRLIREEEKRLGRERTTKVIIITGSEDSDFVSQAFRRFCDAYLVKPIDTEAFLGVLECLCPIDSCDVPASKA